MQQIKDGKKELFIVDDKDGTPTYTHDFAKNVRALIEKEYWGLYNMVRRTNQQIRSSGRIVEFVELERQHQNQRCKF